MTDLLPPSIAIAIATTTTPPSLTENGPDRHLIGVALFEVEEHKPGAFLYRYGARTIPAGSSEAILVDWLNGRLPEGRFMIGWKLADDIIPALLEASQVAAPEDARIFIDALAALVSMDAIDLADRRDIAGRTFSEMCAAGHIPCWPMPEEEVLADWAVGREVELLGFLATNVVAAWRSWAQGLRPDDSVVARSAEAMLATWMIEYDGSVQR